jgi:hypothetical protein
VIRSLPLHTINRISQVSIVGGRVWRSYLRRTFEIVVVLAGSLSLTFCDRLVGLVDPLFPSDAEEFSPPAVYSTWWKMTQACSGMTGSLGSITWFKTNQILRLGNGDPIGGYTTFLTNRIVLTNALVLDGGSVRHEMLHALLHSGCWPLHTTARNADPCDG